MQKFQVLVVSLLTLVLVGCGTGMVRPTAPTGQLTVFTEDFVPSTWNLPLGAVVAEQSNLVLHKQPSASAGLSILFGPLGVIVANEGLKAGTREQVSALDALRTLKMQEETNRLLEQMRRTGHLDAVVALGAKPPAQDHYRIKPYVLLEADRLGMAQVSVIVQVEAKDGKDPAWQGQYVRHVPRRLRLADLSEGAGIDGQQIRQDALDALVLTLDVMAKDLAGGFDGEERAVKFKPTGVLAWSFAKELKGRLAGEYDGYQLMRTDYGAAVPFLYGLHVLDADQYVLLDDQ